MHPFGGTQICPRLNDLIRLWDLAGSYIINRVWHAPSVTNAWIPIPFLNTTESKSCHVKNFGTRDLRQANLPHHDITPEIDRPRSTSPFRNPLLTTPPRVASPLRKYDSNVSLIDANVTTAPRPAISTDTVSSPQGNTSAFSQVKDVGEVPMTPPREPAPVPLLAGTPSNTGRPGHGGIPRTIPLTPTRSEAYPVQQRHTDNYSVGNTPQALGEDSIGGSSSITIPVARTATGTRYGAALTGNLTGNTESPKRWVASANPTCPRCGKSVYFAEQVKAVGKTYHKGCLRCTECNTSLDSNRLRDHDGEPICVRCYGKFHGPHGGGYALLGKAGG
ncbi:Cysteine and glycine-rich protein 3 [Termitomyces sp. J132]|nr:Cysteine and glycine-rich protein 3 [Termitomyces sp. J132]